MYIKVNKRFSRLRDCQILQFSVIESFRVDGKVKHRTLRYLTSIPEQCFKFQNSIESFWKTCEEALEDFSEADRKLLIARLETLVPRVDAEKEAQHAQAMQLVFGNPS